MGPPLQQSIYSLQCISHLISFGDLQRWRNVRLQATGRLAGQFYESKGIVLQQKVTFTGNFNGFFQEVEQERGTVCYFEGRIENFVVLKVHPIDWSQEQASDVIDRIGQNIFVGYFSGFIEEVSNLAIYGVRKCLLRQLIDRNWMYVQSCLKVILPTFSRVQLKSITVISLDKSTATFSGTIVISIQFSYELLELFYHPLNRDRRIAMELNKDLSIQLPLIPGNYSDQKNDVNCSINKNYVMEYKIRRTFNASIDDHYGQFFTPFSLSHANLVLTFQQLKLTNPQRNPTYFDRLRCVQTQHVDEVLIDFMNLDLDDHIDGNLYTPYNDLLKVEDKVERSQLLLKRTTKISFSQRLESGQYYIATNHLSLFTYHSLTFNNSNAINENDCWFLGLTDKSENIKELEVLSIPEEYERGRQMLVGREKHVSKLFHLSLWKHVHVSIPIYKYWVLNLIQIFIPIIILDALSLFIFRQENGKKEDGTSTLNARIINVASILIAYTALIPLIKERAPRATKSSFIYIFIYLSILPHLLALISGIEYKDASNVDWIASYMPFKDLLFFISFVFTAIIVFLVLLVVARFVYASSAQYQIKIPFSSNKFVAFKKSSFPFGANNYIRSLYQKRPNQYIFREVYERQDNPGNTTRFT